MEKVIKVKMQKDKSIKIFLNDQEKYTIDIESRSIDAEKLYEILAFSPGDKFNVLSENESDFDNQVLEYFARLFMDIADKVNSIELNIEEIT